jgi:16S rRNA (uracil1498-N3)-methyltransferase
MELSVSGPRLVVDALPAAGAICRIAGPEAAHAQARRLRRGDRVVLIDGSGREAIGRLVGGGARGLDVEVESVVEAPGDSPAIPPITLAVSAVRAERLSWIAEKATELGAARVTIVTSERTQRFRAADSLGERLQRVVREAAKQAQRARWPEITGPVPLAALLAEHGGGHRFVLDSQGEPFPAALSRAPTALLVGPEGGWSEADLGAALAAGWSVASLAAGLLRAETAAVAALALARAALARSPASLSR